MKRTGGSYESAVSRRQSARAEAQADPAKNEWYNDRCCNGDREYTLCANVGDSGLYVINQEDVHRLQGIVLVEEMVRLGEVKKMRKIIR